MTKSRTPLSAARIVLVLLALAACQQGDEPVRQQTSNQQEENSATSSFDPVRFKDPEFDTRGYRIYTADDLSYYPILRYRQFPIKVGELMRRWNLENEWCRGASGNYPETYHACNRREILGWRIEKLGYCWGSAKANRSEAERHWIKCVDQPDYDPNVPIRQPDLYSNAEIEETTGLPSQSEIGLPP